MESDWSEKLVLVTSLIILLVLVISIAINLREKLLIKKQCKLSKKICWGTCMF